MRPRRLKGAIILLPGIYLSSSIFPCCHQHGSPPTFPRNTRVRARYPPSLRKAAPLKQTSTQASRNIGALPWASANRVLYHARVADTDRGGQVTS